MAAEFDPLTCMDVDGNRGGAKLLCASQRRKRVKPTARGHRKFHKRKPCSLVPVALDDSPPSRIWINDSHFVFPISLDLSAEKKSVFFTRLKGSGEIHPVQVTF